jgi:hypothetical protein
MAIFGRKKSKLTRRRTDTKPGLGRAFPTRTTGNRLRRHDDPPAHRLTKDLSRAQTLAVMLAQSRAAQAVEVADLLAGMYIYDWERLSKYWEEQDAIEEYLQHICRISPPRWHHWIQFYDQQKGETSAKPAPWKWLRPVTKTNGKANSKRLRPSSELQDVFQRAEEISPSHDLIDDRFIPILTCECVLLAMTQRTDSEIGHRLVASGIDVNALEQAARNPKHAPLH